MGQTNKSETVETFSNVFLLFILEVDNFLVKLPDCQNQNNNFIEKVVIWKHDIADNNNLFILVFET